MKLVRVAETSAAVSATSKRSEKVALLAELVAAASPEEIEIVVGLLIGSPRQGRIGIGWSTVSKLDLSPSPAPSLTVSEIDDLLTQIATTTGAGSRRRRADLLEGVLRRATETELDFVRRVLVGEIRQGALAGVVTDGLAKGLGVPMNTMRRAAMLEGDLGRAAVVAATGGTAALEAVGLRIGRGIEPMLASTAVDVAEALAGTDDALVEWKLDGARIQVHKLGDEVRIFTRNLNDVTERLPFVVSAVAAFDHDQLVLDGEVMGVRSDGRPHPFQDTMSSFGTDARPDAVESDSGTDPGTDLQPFFFDLLHVDGRDLIDEPLAVRRSHLIDVVGSHQIPGVELHIGGADAGLTEATAQAARHLDEAIAAGHEGVMVKALDSRYEAGRRGKSWRKVKPVHTLDLVVLAAEWGHGRRTGWLSNLHLGARDPETGDFVMVGKTFKGLTDELLAWQTSAFLEREVERSASGHTVHLRPELVVEIAVDGVQSSTRYPGGVALRFARVKGYRPDRDPSSADTITAVQLLRDFSL
jgi:DNA ligase-1